MSTKTETFESTYDYCSTRVTLEFDPDNTDPSIERGHRQPFACPECGREHVFHRVEEENPSGATASGGEAEVVTTQSGTGDQTLTVEEAGEPEAEAEAEPETEPEPGSEPESAVEGAIEEAEVDAEDILAELEAEPEEAVTLGTIPFNPEDRTVPEVREALEDVDDLETLEALAERELEQENRITAIDAIEARAEKLRRA